MGKNRKHNKRKRRLEMRTKLKKSVVGIPETKKYIDTDYNELEKEMLDLLRAPGAVTLFFDEKRELVRKIKVLDQ